MGKGLIIDDFIIFVGYPVVVAICCKVNCRASAIFSESTQVYDDYFVIIEQCTVDTKTI